MESLNNILKKSLNKEFLSAIISNPREKDGIVNAMRGKINGTVVTA